jgi:hypothetical protein
VLCEKLASIGVDNISVPNACFCCGHLYRESECACRNCGTQFWCEWQVDWYKSRLTKISMGQDPYARKISNAFAVTSAAILITVASTSYLLAGQNRSLLHVFIGLAIGGWSVIEVRAYCHGLTTTIEHCTHGAKPENTYWRTLGLFFDLVTLIGALYLLARM